MGVGLKKNVSRAIQTSIFKGTSLGIGEDSFEGKQGKQKILKGGKTKAPRETNKKLREGYGRGQSVEKGNTEGRNWGALETSTRRRTACRQRISLKKING